MSSSNPHGERRDNIVSRSAPRGLAHDSIWFGPRHADWSETTSIPASAMWIEARHDLARPNPRGLSPDSIWPACRHVARRGIRKNPVDEVLRNRSVAANHPHTVGFCHFDSEW